MTNGSAPGKVILVGEHFVVHGAPAIALPLLSARVQARVVDGSAPWQCPAGTLSHLERLVEALGGLPEGARLEIDSNLPIGVGLGSSAALAVALVRALADPQVSDGEVRQRAHRLEQISHGTPSGIDDTVASLERAVRFSRQEGLQPLDVLPSGELWIGVVPRHGSTQSAVAMVRERAQANPDWMQALLERARSVVERAHQSLRSGDMGSLGASMNANQRLLEELGVSTPTLERLQRAALQAGAWGAKLTGAGMGGALIALAPTDCSLDEPLRKAGAERVMRTHFNAATRGQSGE